MRLSINPFKKSIILFLFISLISFSCQEKEAEPTPVETEAEPILTEEEPREIRNDLELIAQPEEVEMEEDWMAEVHRQKAEQNGVILRESIDTSQMTVNYFSAQSVDRSNLQMPDDGRELEIIDYGPTGQLPIEVMRPSIFVQFNKPMVPLSKLGEPVRESTILQIEPETPGIYRWYGTSMLAFEPDEPLLRFSLYKARVSRDVQSLSGASLKRNLEFEFYMEELKMVNFWFYSNGEPYRGSDNIPNDRSKRIYISFNQSVDAQWLAPFIEIKKGKSSYDARIRQMNEEDGGSITSAHRTIVLELQEDLPADSDIRLLLEEGASAFEGAMVNEKAESRKFHTLRPFKFVGQSRYGGGFPADPHGLMNPVFFSFNQPLADNALDFMETSFDDTVDIAEHARSFNHQIRLNRLPVTYGDEYQVLFKAGLSDIYGQTLEEDITQKVVVPNAASFLQTESGYRILEAEYAPRVIYQYQNLKEGTLRIEGGNPIDLTEDQVLNQANFKLVDLTPWLNEQGYGKVRLVWDYTTSYYDYRNNEKTQSHDTELQVQVTDIGLTVRYGYNRLLIWANRLSSGEPLSGASISIRGNGNGRPDTQDIRTDSNGLALIPLNPGEFNRYFLDSRNRFGMNITVTKDKDQVDFNLRNTHGAYRFGVSQNAPQYAERQNQRVFYFTDRGLYKPGETLTIRGMDWSQVLGDFKAYQGKYKVELCEPGYNGDVIDTVNGETSESGGFYLTFDLDKDLLPDFYVLKYYRDGWRRGQSLRFQVANFRRLNFQVNIQVPNRPFIMGEDISLPLEASYLAGGVMAGGDMKYSVTRKPVQYVPPGELWKGWSVGPLGWDSERTIENDRDSLDSLGRAILSVSTARKGIEGKAYRYIFESTVEDIDRQTVSSAASVVCHPSDRYIAARLGGAVQGWWSPFVESGTPQELSLALINLQGELAEESKPVQVEIYRGEYKVVQQQGVSDYINTRYEWTEELLETRKTELKGGLARIPFNPEDPGSYRIRISGADQEGRSFVTEMKFYATGGRWIRWASNNDEDINLIADKTVYFDGDTARIMVQSPLPEGRYLMTIEREGILEEKILHLNNSTSVIEVPISDAYVPVIYVTLCTFRNRESLPESYYEPDFGRPKGYFGAVQLDVSTQTRELDVEILADKGLYRPADEAEVVLKVTRNGQPVAGAEVIFLAVDRGVLDIIYYHIPNPLSYFYDRSHFPLYVNGDDNRRMLMKPVTYDVSNLIGGDGEGNKLDRREDFSPLAVFEPMLITNDQGLAVSKFTLPDTLTTYRSTAIALQGNRLGYLENEIMVQNPINVRTALPRRLRLRDTAFAGCILHNLDDVAHKVTLDIRSDILNIAGDRQKELEIPAGGIYEVPFILEATRQGEGEIIFTVHSEVLNEEIVEPFIVERPLIKEAFTTIGMIGLDDGDALEEGLLIPTRIASGYGSLSTSVDSTMTPFVNSHVIPLLSNWRSGLYYSMNRTIAMALFPKEFHSLGYGSSGDINASIERMLETLEHHQLPSGAIYYLYPEYGGNYYLSVRTAFLLGLLKSHDPAQEWGGDISALKAYIQKNLPGRSPYVQSFSLYSLSHLGVDTEALVDDLIEEAGDKLGISGYGMLALCYEELGKKRKAQSLYEQIKKYMLIGTQTVDISETWEAWDYFDSDYTQMAMLLNLAIAYDKNIPLLMKLVNSLNPDMHQSNWMTQNDHIWSLMALKRFQTLEGGEDTDFTARLELNGQSQWDVPFQGTRSEKQIQSWALEEDPLLNLERDKLHSLVFRRDGEGTLFYSSTLRYALPTEVAPARDEGISVLSRIETMEGEEITDDKLTLGDTYRMRVILSTPKDRSNVQLSVSVPSGADIIDPSFKASSRFFSSGGVMEESWKRNTGYGDEEEYIGEGYANLYEWYFWWIRPKTYIFDNRIDYLWESIYKGQREISFLFRATTPGVYPTPPAMVELEYEPEVFGRDAGRLYVIR